MPGHLAPQRPPQVKLSCSLETSGSHTKFLTFEGRVAPKDHYGIFVRVTPGGTIATFGLFVDPAGLSLDAIAKKVADSINNLPKGVKGLVSALPSGPRVSITRAEDVDCFIQADIRVGHPTDNFAWPCSNQIGRVIDSRLDVDAALVELDSGLKYKPEILGIGSVDGFLPKAMLSHDLGVQKSGFASGVTTGRIIALDASGFATGVGTGITAGTGGFRVFKRFYNNAMIIESTTVEDPVSGTLRPFIVAGDSGSAVVTLGKGPVKVVGLAFAGDEGTTGVATPIEYIMGAFDQHKLSFSLVPGEDPNTVKTVPAPGVAFEALSVDGAPESGETEIAPMGIRWAGSGRWSEVERGFAAALWPGVRKCLQTPFRRGENPCQHESTRRHCLAAQRRPGDRKDIIGDRLKS